MAENYVEIENGIWARESDPKSKLDWAGEWKEERNLPTEAGSVYEGPVLWLEAEIRVAKALQWMLWDSLIEAVGSLKDFLGGGEYLRVIVYTSLNDSELFKLAWAFKKPESVALTESVALFASPILIPVAALVAAIGVLFWAGAIVIQSVRVRPENLKVGPLGPGIGGIFSNIRNLLLIGLGIMVLYTLGPTIKPALKRTDGG